MRGSVEVHTFLLEREIPHEFFRPEHAPREPSDLPTVLGVDPDECVRVRVFDAPDGPIVAVAPVSVEPDPELVAEAAGVAEVRRATSAAVSRVTGYSADWAPPLAHQRAVRVLVHKDLCHRDVVYAPAGERGLVLKIRGEDLCRATGGEDALLGHPA